MSMSSTNLIGKLDVSYDYDFDLIGLVASVKEYKLAWMINQVLEINLVKEDDLEINFRKGESLVISNYIFETEYSIITLYVNKSVNPQKNNKPYLLPELKEYDYFFKFEGDSDLFANTDLVETLKGIDVVQFASLIDVEELPSRDNVIN